MNKAAKRIVLMMISLIAVLALAACGKKEAKVINLNDYVNVISVGYDKVGSLYVELDYSKVIEDNEKIFGEDTKLAERWLKQVKFECQPSYMLKNGDTAKITASKVRTDDFMDTFNVQVEFPEYTYTVAGLTALADYDPFEGVVLYQSGYDFVGNISVDSYAAEYSDYLEYTILDPKENYANGDVVTVSVQPREYYTDFATVEDFLADKGKKPTRLTCEYELTEFAELSVYDPSNSFHVEFNGSSPNGTAYVYYDSYDYGLSFSLDKFEGLSNGDVVTVTLDKNGYTDEEFAKNLAYWYGIAIDETKWAVTVSGLRDLLVSADQIPYEVDDEMRKIIGEDLTNYVENYVFDGRGTVLDIYYIGDIIHTVDDYWGGLSSTRTMVFDIEIMDSCGDYYPVYWAASFGNLYTEGEDALHYDLYNYYSAASDYYESYGYVNGPYVQCSCGSIYNGFVDLDYLKSYFNIYDENITSDTVGMYYEAIPYFAHYYGDRPIDIDESEIDW